VEKINQSVMIIKNSRLDYIFRTTVVPRIHQEKDLLAIGEWLKGARVFQLQQFSSQKQLILIILKSNHSRLSSSYPGLSFLALLSSQSGRPLKEEEMKILVKR